LKVLSEVKNGYVIITVIALAAFLLPIEAYCQVPDFHNVQSRENQSSGSSNNTKLVILNFDDTNMDQIGYAKPILDKYGFKATFFPVCGWIHSQAGWQAIAALQKDGMDIQSHTMTHPNLNGLSAAQLDYEIGRSKQCLLSHGINTTIFAYPYGAGSNNATVVNTVAKYYNLARTATYSDSVYTATFEDRYSINSWVPLYIEGPYDYGDLSCKGGCRYYDDSQQFERFIEEVNNQNNYDRNGTIRAIPIIVYHGFVPYDNISEKKIPTDTSVNLFNREMEYLHDNGFKVLTMADLGYDESSNSLYLKSSS
jgi:peptidoglycan/xylan/chitin deacetylase (PgdA/CDA1 family)